MKKTFTIRYAKQVFEDIRAVEKQHHSLIKEAIETALTFEPDVETINRKPLIRPTSIGSSWELRCGPDNRFRIFYTIDFDHFQVNILAIGMKVRNVLYIGGKEFKL